jgi:hypothetical protein
MEENDAFAARMEDAVCRSRPIAIHAWMRVRSILKHVFQDCGCNYHVLKTCWLK